MNTNKISNNQQISISQKENLSQSVKKRLDLNNVKDVESKRNS